MLPPEITRVVLLIALAATGYLMILAWNDDMEAARTPVGYSDAPLASGQLATDTPQTLAVTEALNVPTDDDVPQNSLLVENSDVPNQEVEELVPVEVVNTNQLVTVETSALRLWVDLVGGDIVRVQLPEFPVSLDRPDIPFLLLDRGATSTYVAQSGLIGADGPDSSGRAKYSASTSQLRVASGETKQLVLTTPIDGGRVEKIFTFRDADYLVDVEYVMYNNSAAPKRAGMFSQIKRDSRPPSTDESFALAPQPYLGAAFTTSEERYLKIDFDDIDDDGEFKSAEVGGWVAFLQHYFLSAWVAPAEQANRYYGRRSRDGTYLFGFTGPAMEVAPGQEGRWSAQFYAGPKDQKRLEQISENLNLTVDYGFLWWVAVPLFYLLDWLYELVGNWGVAIILLTFVVKALLYPLSAAGYKSMANMRRVAPAMKKLQERYGNDREKLSKEMMALYQKEGANPLGGCLPMLLPMPIFIALYWVLFESVELRQAPFFGWIEDLAVMDPFFILPLLMGASMYWMQTLNPQVGDPMQVKMMKMMPIMFTVLFLFFPAGLVLYWLVNNILSVAQQQYVYKQADKAHAAKAG
ncbi:MAG: membrane protein insertase YidC [Pseudomonadota bacterium]